MPPVAPLFALLIEASYWLATCIIALMEFDSAQPLNGLASRQVSGLAVKE